MRQLIERLQRCQNEQAAPAPRLLAVTCPTCGKRLRLPENSSGKKVICPGCRGRIETPASPTEPLLPREESAPIELVATLRTTTSPSPPDELVAPSPTTTLPSPPTSLLDSKPVQIVLFVAVLAGFVVVTMCILLYLLHLSRYPDLDGDGEPLERSAPSVE